MNPEDRHYSHGSVTNPHYGRTFLVITIVAAVLFGGYLLLKDTDPGNSYGYAINPVAKQCDIKKSDLAVVGFDDPRDENGVSPMTSGGSREMFGVHLKDKAGNEYWTSHRMLSSGTKIGSAETITCGNDEKKSSPIICPNAVNGKIAQISHLMGYFHISQVEAEGDAHMEGLTDRQLQVLRAAAPRINGAWFGVLPKSVEDSVKEKCAV